MPKIEKKKINMGGIGGGSNLDMFGGENTNSSLVSPDKKTLSDTSRLTTKYIAIEKIKDNESNRFSVKNTYFLEQSIKKLGQLQPIILINQLDEDENPTGNYEIKAGSRRFQALNNLRLNAIENEDTETERKYSQAWVTILPIGATPQEIDEVITETNTTSRHIGIEDLFRNFEFMFELDEEGNFVNIPKNTNKYEAGVRMLKDMGYDYSAASVRDFLTIYMAHNKEIRTDFENGFLSKKQALTVARMQPSMQDSVMEKFKDFTAKEIADYLKTYNLEKKDKDKNNIKGIDVLNNVSKTSKQIKNLKDKRIHFKDDMQKAQVISLIKEMYEELEELMKKIDK